MARGGSNWLGKAIFFVVCGYFAVKYLADRTDAEPEEAAAAAASPGAGRPYALNAARSDWPPLEEGAQIQLALERAGASNYYVVLDGSGSMRREECSGGKTKIAAAVEALNHFVPNVPADANLGLTVFDGNGISERVPLGIDNRDAFRKALLAVEANGGTPLRSSMELAYQQLLQQGRSQLGYGDYHLVVVTDGYPEPDSEDPAGFVGTLLNDTPVVLHTIGFCIGTDHVLNQPGRTLYVAADSPAQLAQGLDSVLAEAPAFDLTQFKE